MTKRNSALLVDDDDEFDPTRPEGNDDSKNDDNADKGAERSQRREQRDGQQDRQQRHGRGDTGFQHGRESTFCDWGSTCALVRPNRRSRRA